MAIANHRFSVSDRRPSVHISCAMSLNGLIDDGSTHRLILSNGEDSGRVRVLRAGVDAILVGAATVRRDNPSLVAFRDQDAGEVSKVTLTRSGRLDRQARFFSHGGGLKIVYATSRSYRRTSDGIGDVADVVDAGADVSIAWVLADLYTRGINSLLVEGGAVVIGKFISSGLFDRLSVSVAPMIVRRAGAVSLVDTESMSGFVGERMKLEDCQRVGDCALLSFSLAERNCESS